MTCQTCGRPMTDFRLLDASKARWICNFRDCPSHYQNHRCPKCTLAPIRVSIVEFPLLGFQCHQNHQWFYETSRSRSDLLFKRDPDQKSYF